MSDDEQPLRGESGRFLPGHKSISPGRPKRAEEAEYVEATMRACTPEDWQRIVASAVKDCASRKVSERSAARHFLLRALFGSTPGALVQIANVTDAAPPLERALQFIAALSDFVRVHAPEHAVTIGDVLEPFGKALADAGGDPRVLVELSDLPRGKLSPERLERLHRTIRDVYGVDLPTKAPAQARGLSEEDARFWRNQVLMGDRPGASPARQSGDD